MNTSAFSFALSFPLSFALPFALPFALSPASSPALSSLPDQSADDWASIAGTDEVGRGPLAGDVVAAAVILDPEKPLSGLRDSKKLAASRRESLYQEIQDKALATAIARATVAEIDAINILQASLLAMRRAVESLALQPAFVYVDGNRCPPWGYPSQAVVKGDDLIPAIAAASILAKVTRDREMLEMDSAYPGYGFAQHKGYPTAMHRDALQKLGPCPIHRRSFAPVAKALK